MFYLKDMITDYLSLFRKLSLDSPPEKGKIEIIDNGNVLATICLHPLKAIISDISSFLKRNPNKRLAHLSYKLLLEGKSFPISNTQFCASLIQASILLNGGLNIFTDTSSVALIKESGFPIYPLSIMHDLQLSRIPSVRGVIALFKEKKQKIFKLLIYQFSLLPSNYFKESKVISLVCKDIIQNRAFLVDLGPYSYYSYEEVKSDFEDLTENDIENLFLCFIAMTAKIKGDCPFILEQKEVVSDLLGKSYFLLAFPRKE